MESKKIARMNLFSGQQWRNRRREQTYRHGGRRGGRSMKRVTEIYNNNKELIGIQLEAYSIEDDCEIICFNVFLHNPKV